MQKQTDAKAFKMNVNLETTPILYTDNIRMTTNSHGVVLSFGQILDTTDQVKIVARIGMSRAHAKEFLGEMGKLLAMTEGQLQTKKKQGN